MYRYRKYELATRYAFLYTSVPIAGAVSGLLAGVITEFMEDVAGLPGWRWLFVSSIRTDCLIQADIFYSDPRRPCICDCSYCHLLPHARLPRQQQALPQRRRNPSRL